MHSANHILISVPYKHNYRIFHKQNKTINKDNLSTYAIHATAYHISTLYIIGNWQWNCFLILSTQREFHDGQIDKIRRPTIKRW